MSESNTTKRHQPTNRRSKKPSTKVENDGIIEESSREEMSSKEEKPNPLPETPAHTGAHDTTSESQLDETTSNQSFQTTIPTERKIHLGEDFLVQTHFDRSSQQYNAKVVELPDISVSGKSRSSVLEEIEDKLESHLEILRRRGEKLPEALQGRSYPEKLEVPISQSLYRKLDLLSRQEKIAMDLLVTELLTSAMEKKHDRVSTHVNRDSHHNRDNQHQGHQRRDHHNNRHQGGGPRGGRNIHTTLGSRENFMEYVRNLEKRDWRKK